MTAVTVKKYENKLNVILSVIKKQNKELYNEIKLAYERNLYYFNLSERDYIIELYNTTLLICEKYENYEICYQLKKVVDRIRKFNPLTNNE